MSKVCLVSSSLTRSRTFFSSMSDKAWLDTLNAERKKEQVDTVSYETFEVMMDRLEKEWFDLVRTNSFSFVILLKISV
jgi:hypothetical protein